MGKVIATYITSFIICTLHQYYWGDENQNAGERWNRQGNTVKARNFSHKASAAHRIQEAWGNGISGATLTKNKKINAHDNW
jgi:hypothetical protein